jgi:hypothetical protein
VAQIPHKQANIKQRERKKEDIINLSGTFLVVLFVRESADQSSEIRESARTNFKIQSAIS